MQRSNESREKRLQRLGETLKTLTPEQRKQAQEIAAKLLAKKAQREKG